LSYTTNGTTWLPEPVLLTTGTTLDVTIPTAGLPYTFRIRSTNTFGQSPYATAELTPLRAPGNVTGLSVRQLASGEVTLGWNANAAIEAVTGYRIEFSSGNNIWTLFDGAAVNTLTTVTGLTNGTPYTFRVSARNVAGFGTGAVTNGTPAGPLPVNAIAANAADSKVTLSWSLPAASGVTITGIRVRYTNDNGVTVITHGTLAATATSSVIESLTNGSAYTFEVTVLTNLGESAPMRVAATPWAQLPSIVGNLTATPTATAVALDWDTPVTTGVGSVSYRVEYKLATATDWTTAAAGELATAFNVTGLVAASGYDFRVTAVNAAGNSPVATIAATTGA
jgi:titin